MKERIDELTPKTAPSVYIHPSAVISGNVTLGDHVSIWPCAVLRGDIAEICIGENSNIQDNACVHVNHNCPAQIGRGVTVGHGAIVHGSKIGDNCLIGMNAVVLDSEIGANCLIAAGAVVTAGKNIPAGSLVMGVPAKVIRELTEDEMNEILQNAREYAKLGQLYKDKAEPLS